MLSRITLKNFGPLSKLDWEARDRINLIAGGNGTRGAFRSQHDNRAEREAGSS